MNEQQIKKYKIRQFIGDIFIHTGEMIVAIISLSNPLWLIGLVIFMIIEVGQNKYNLSRIM